MMWIYSLGVWLFFLIMSIRGWINPKARKWVKGQKNKEYPILKNSTWVHCASLGEYYQALPLIEMLEKRKQEIVITFFSPSGYDEVAKSKRCFYLPLDTPANANRFINSINPKLAIFVRSEFWFNHIQVLGNKRIPIVVLNSFLSKDHYFFKWYGKWALNQIRKITLFFTVEEASKNLLTKFGLNHACTTGDTKVDQVLHRSNSNILFKNNFDKKIILIASAEKGDREIVKNIILDRRVKNMIVIVPHEPSKEMFDYYNKVSNFELKKYSELNGESAELIYVDQFGILTTLYNQAWLSYVGGGFDKGVHNILESCVAKTPMIFGPKHEKFIEAKRFIDLQIAILIEHEEKVIGAIKSFEDPIYYKTATTECEKYIEKHKGASQKVLDLLISNKLV